ncbi:hypothetical protein TSUD_406120 [Trifolium subterraneum]|uniref:Reverse transcriptase zinc-binding domain-containing protein n=1 Tax=Trifolium subterraneum TaxID=3900 RepID=A0A2Z6PPC4_TRISU|nr:hypothetical protein TSUD_406120 [Trifolium subterraneum]
MHSDEDWAKILRNRVMRKGKAINHHINSSIWSSVKQEVQVILDNSCWRVGNGQCINLWTDSWCGEPLATSQNIHPNILIWLPSKVSDFIQNQTWYIPRYIDILFPQIKNLVYQVILPVDNIADSLVWKGSDNGLLTLKIAYDFKRPHAPFLPWAKSIWSKDIPPTRSLLAWRVMLDKVPTDDKLIERGCNLPSMCSLCNIHSETLFHLFFQCSFSFQIWCWLASVLDVTLHFSSMTDIWQLAENWSPQCKVVINAALVHILYAIWIARNKVRFKNEKYCWRSSVSWISSNISMAELWAIRIGIDMASQLNIRNVSFEMDSLVVVNMVNSGSTPNAFLQPLLQEQISCTLL